MDNNTGIALDLALCQQDFDPHVLLSSWERNQGSAATAVFLGRMRDLSLAGETLLAMELEHYPGMCEDQLQELAMHHSSAHAVDAVLLRHRVGRVRPGEALVVLAVAAARRGPAQRCCQDLLEAVKHQAPFWKREITAAGRCHWVQGNTPL